MSGRNDESKQQEEQPAFSPSHLQPQNLAETMDEAGMNSITPTTPLSAEQPCRCECTQECHHRCCRIKGGKIRPDTVVPPGVTREQMSKFSTRFPCEHVDCDKEICAHVCCRDSMTPLKRAVEQVHEPVQQGSSKSRKSLSERLRNNAADRLREPSQENWSSIVKVLEYLRQATEFKGG